MNVASEEATYETTARVFRTAYYVAKESKPFTYFKSLIDLQQANASD